MSNSQRTVIAGAVLVCATALAIAGLIADTQNAAGYIGAALGMMGTILGYVFGRANGEKALAGAIVTAAAEGTAQHAVDTAVAHVMPKDSPLSSPPAPLSGETD